MFFFFFLLVSEENKLGCQLSELPENLIYEIGKRLTIYADYVRLRSTSKSFQSLLPKLPNHQLSQVPWLMIPPANDASETHCKFFSILENKMYKLELPKVQGKLLRGSSCGWALMIDGYPELNLINPLTRAQIQLPPIDTFPDVLGYRPYMADEEYLILRVRPNLPKPAKVQVESIAYVRDVFIHKLVLSSNPNTSKEYMAMAIYGMVSDLAFCKNGDKKWTLIQQNDQHINHDIISHKGKFYVLRNDGGLWVGDRNSLPNMTQLVPSLPKTILNYFSLVRTISGEFFMVRKIHELEPISCIDHIYSYKTIDFVVYKLDHHQGELKWRMVKNIGDNVFFVGINDSLCISSQNLARYKGNCIYFTDDYFDCHREGIVGGHDMGVYNVEDRSIKPLPGYNYYLSHTMLVWPPPIWFSPNP